MEFTGSIFEAIKRARQGDTRVLPFLVHHILHREEVYSLRNREAIQTLEMFVSMAAPALGEALAHESPIVRMRAAFALNSLVAKPLLPVIMPYLRDGSDGVRLSAARILATMNDKPMVADILPLLTDAHPTGRLSAVRMLGPMADESIMSDILPLLTDPHPIVRWEAMRIVDRFADTSMLPFIVPLLDDEQHNMRLSAAVLAARLGDVRAIPVLIALSQFENDHWSPRVKQMQAALTSVRSAALPLLVDAFNNEDRNIPFFALFTFDYLADQSATPYLITLLDSPDQRTRRKAMSRLRYLADPSTKEAMLKTLTHYDKELRGLAVITLAKIGGDDLIEVLTGMLQDENAWVRTEAAKALTFLGESHGIPVLMQSIHESEHGIWVSDSIIESFMALPQVAIPALIETLRDARSDVRARAGFALYRLRNYAHYVIDHYTSRHRGATPTLIDMLHDKNIDVHAFTAQLYEQLNAPNVVSAFGQALTDPSQDVRHYAAIFLAELGDTQVLSELLDEAYTYERFSKHFFRVTDALNKLKDLSTPILIAKLQSSNLDEIRRTTEILRYYRDPALVPAIINLLQDQDEEFRKWAAFVLSRNFNDARAVIALINYHNYELDSDPNRWDVATYLGGERSEVILKELLVHEDPRVRLWAVHRIMQRGNRTLLYDLIHDSHPLIQATVREALHGVYEEMSDVPDILRKLYHEDAHIRAIAAYALGILNVSSSVPALIEHLADSVAEVRESAAAALGLIGNRRAVEALTIKLQDPDWRVREECALALRRINDEAISWGDQIYTSDQ